MESSLEVSRMTGSTDVSEFDETLQESLESAFSRPAVRRDDIVISAQNSVREEADGARVERLPSHIDGGFNGVAADLDRRSRDSASMVRLLEQQRVHLEAAELERDRLYLALGRLTPEVNESGRSLKTMIETAKSGDVSGDLSAEFSRNLRALDELENIAQALSANLLWTRSGWEQYARSVIGAQMMREGRSG